MRKKKIALYLLLIPNVSFANAAIPVVAYTFVEMVFLLIPVIYLEAATYRKYLKVGWKTGLWGSFWANLATTVVGLPLAWILYLIPSVAAYGVAAYFKPEFLGHKTYLTEILRGLFGAILMPYFGDQRGQGSDVPTFSFFIAQAIMLIPAFYVTVWGETKLLRRIFKNIDHDEIKTTVKKANIQTYLLLFVFTFLAWGYLMHFHGVK